MKRKPSHDLISRQREVTNRRRLQAAKFDGEHFHLADIKDRIAALRAAKLQQEND